MSRLFNTTHNEQFYHIIILVIRVIITLFMLVHGLSKLKILLSDGPSIFPDPLQVGIENSLSLAVFSEVICSFFIFLGLGTRLAVIPLIFTMFIAIFIVHEYDGFAKQELGGLYMMIYLVLLVTGSGKYSVDYLIEKNNYR